MCGNIQQLLKKQTTDDKRKYTNTQLEFLYFMFSDHKVYGTSEADKEVSSYHEFISLL